MHLPMSDYQQEKKTKSPNFSSENKIIKFCILMRYCYASLKFTYQSRKTKTSRLELSLSHYCLEINRQNRIRFCNNHICNIYYYIKRETLSECRRRSYLYQFGNDMLQHWALATKQQKGLSLHPHHILILKLASSLICWTKLCRSSTQPVVLSA